MGCFSRCTLLDRNNSSAAASTASANIIAIDGQLRQYLVPVSVSRVLQTESEAAASASAPLSSPFVVCNSDSLCYDEYITALDPDHQLEPNQIYFILPSSKLPYRLIASDMAALAVKASTALSLAGVVILTTNSSRRRRRRNNNKNARISPNIPISDSNHDRFSDDKHAERIDRVSSRTMKVQRSSLSPSSSSSSSSSRKGRYRLMALPSFRLRLSTINE